MPPQSKKPSAAELLARLSGRQKMEPTKEDAIQDIESCPAPEALKKKTDPPPTQTELNNAAGLLMAFEDTYKSVVGDRYTKRPQMRLKDEEALRDLFEATHGFRWADARGWIGRGYPGRLGVERRYARIALARRESRIDPKANRWWQWSCPYLTTSLKARCRHHCRTSSFSDVSTSAVICSVESYPPGFFMASRIFRYVADSRKHHVLPPSLPTFSLHDSRPL